MRKRNVTQWKETRAVKNHRILQRKSLISSSWRRCFALLRVYPEQEDSTFNEQPDVKKKKNTLKKCFLAEAWRVKNSKFLMFMRLLVFFSTDNIITFSEMSHFITFYYQRHINEDSLRVLIMFQSPPKYNTSDFDWAQRCVTASNENRPWTEEEPNELCQD